MTKISKEFGVSSNNERMGSNFQIRLVKSEGRRIHAKKTMSLAEEIAVLRKQNKELTKVNKRLQEENEFLAEASAFFAASRRKSAKTRD